MADHKRWLETLFERMSAPAALMRQHLRKNHHNPTLGAAAEAGVRDLLRAVLPARIGVTSGFVRAEAGDGEAQATSKVSPQTDVILYDTSRVVPLHSIGGVDVFAARDVLGVIEVKDTARGSKELAYVSKKGRKTGALRHIGQIGLYAPDALRAVVLFRGKAGGPGEEVGRAAKCFSDIRADNLRVVQTPVKVGARSEEELPFPHLVYCASYDVTEGEKKDVAGYLAFDDVRTGQMRFHEYAGGERVFALSCFLRVVTGFFAAQRLTSPSLHFDLKPPRRRAARKEVPVREGGPEIASLYEALRKPSGGGAAANRAPLTEQLVEFLKGLQNDGRLINVPPPVPATFHDAEGLPTVGFHLTITAGPAPSRGSRGRPGASREEVFETYFVCSESDEFVCAEAGNDDADWCRVDATSLKEYVREVRQRSDVGRIVGASYGGSPGATSRHYPSVRGGGASAKAQKTSSPRRESRRRRDVKHRA